MAGLVYAYAVHASGAIERLCDGSRGDELAPFGPATADAVKDLKPGEFTKPRTAANGYAVYRVQGIGTSFEEVTPAIDEMIAGKEAAPVLFELLSKAKTRSRLISRATTLCLGLPRVRRLRSRFRRNRVGGVRVRS